MRNTLLVDNFQIHDGLENEEETENAREHLQGIDAKGDETVDENTEIEPTGKKSRAKIGKNRKRSSRFSRVFLICFVILGGLIAFSFDYHLPYYALKPGAAVPTNNLINISGVKTSKIQGQIDLVYVIESNVPLIVYPIDKFSSSVTLYKSSEIASTPTGILSQSALDSQNAWFQNTSQISAEVAALRSDGYTISSVNNGALIGWIDPTAPASKFLASGDKIVSVGAFKVSSDEDLVKAIQSLKPHSEVTIGFVTPNSDKTNYQRVKLAAQSGSSSNIPYLGVGLMPVYRIPLKISINDVVNGESLGGPSAGLAYSLTIVDMLEGGDLTKGENIAATGTIDSHGNVGPIGGLLQKTIAVLNAGCKIFFVPEGQSASTYSQIFKLAGNRMKIYKVETLNQVLSILKSGH